MFDYDESDRNPIEESKNETYRENTHASLSEDDKEESNYNINIQPQNTAKTYYIEESKTCNYPPDLESYPEASSFTPKHKSNSKEGKYNIPTNFLQASNYPLPDPKTTLLTSIICQ